MIVDHIQNHTDSERMRGVHEPAKIVRVPVQMRWREHMHAVVAPSKPPRELCDGHYLEDRNSSFGKMGKLGGSAGPAALFGERADMHLVDDLTLERDALPRRISPQECARIHNLRGEMRTLGLKSRCRIGEAAACVQSVFVARARCQTLREASEITRRFLLERNYPLFAPLNHHVHATPLRAQTRNSTPPPTSSAPTGIRLRMSLCPTPY